MVLFGEDMGRLEEQDFDEKRLARRNRRKRSQTLAYIILGVLVLVLVGGAALGVHFLSSVIGQRKTQDAQDEGLLSATENQESVAIETPAEPTPEELEMSSSDVADEVIGGILSEMTLEDKVAGLFFLTPEQLTGVATVVKAGSSTQDALSQYSVGGLLYSAKNLKSQDQISEMLKATASMCKYPIFLATTEETTPSSSITASLGGIDTVDLNSSDAAYTTGSNIAAVMFKYGFNLDLAPSLDITENGLYGTDVDVVKDITGAFTRGLEESGITACLHDFPISADTSAGTVSSDITVESLSTGSYEVFKNAITNGGARAIMLSNVSLPQVTGDNTPVSLSQKMIQEELRGVIGFDGVVITGPLYEGAITENYSSDQAAVAAIKAGADMLYMPEDFNSAYQAILSAVESGEISKERIDESLTRIFMIKYADRIAQITEN